MVLVLMGCGSAVFAGSAAGAVSAGVGTLGVAFAFGLSVVAMAYAIGGISGCHINPAITLGVLLSGRMSGKDAAMYMVFQVIGAVIGSAILYALVSTGAHGGPTATGSNGFADGMMKFRTEGFLFFPYACYILCLIRTAIWLYPFPVHEALPVRADGRYRNSRDWFSSSSRLPSGVRGRVASG